MATKDSDHRPPCVVPLDSTNYAQWKYSMKWVLVYDKLWAALDRVQTKSIATKQAPRPDSQRRLRTDADDITKREPVHSHNRRRLFPVLYRDAPEAEERR